MILLFPFQFHTFRMLRNSLKNYEGKAMRLQKRLAFFVQFQVGISKSVCPAVMRKNYANLVY